MHCQGRVGWHSNRHAAHVLREARTVRAPGAINLRREVWKTTLLLKEHVHSLILQPLKRKPLSAKSPPAKTS